MRNIYQLEFKPNKTIKPTAYGQYQTFSCINGSCSNVLAAVQYHTCSATEACAYPASPQSVSELCGSGFCADGKYLNNGACVACPPGQWTVWSPGGDVLTSCSPCPPGFYANSDGMQCTLCPKDYFCTGGANIQTCASVNTAPYYKYSAPGTGSYNACQLTPYSGT